MLGCPAQEHKKKRRKPGARLDPAGLDGLCSARIRGRCAGAGLSDKADPGDRLVGAGGISDIFMRTVGEELSKRWGQPIVIENRAGGGMNIGGRACAEAPPDGYTICIMSNEVVTYNQYLYKTPGFDAEKSIAPVTNLFFLTQALVVNSSLK